MAELEVEIVAADHFVWSGGAKMLKARTADGEIGILPGHTPVLAILHEGTIEIQPVSGDRIVVEADGGFFSVDTNRVVIVADNAHISESVAGTR
ncbi:F0F1 ATP synthase subunit epsilon [Sinomonas terrae]|jgi:F-type H+-transporting ATPase subunit epsilon|uniref:F0F1 ATP synthase subunit epsilon n=1 Tax=Sinomonas terrae TaxID=2908838 RepID=A0ABS9TZA3_9MICC|nr:F0F1 ATP synthase subunit epsilon [Sinomonas terrae]MCH6469753.1 F0F1 ATP synthase subunit epsilon [Sinomonas terrae]